MLCCVVFIGSFVLVKVVQHGGYSGDRCVVIWCVVVRRGALHSIVLCCIVLYCVVLYCVVFIGSFVLVRVVQHGGCRRLIPLSV